MFFPNHKIIFVHIPKTGGSSLEYAICKKLLPESKKPVLDGYNKFSVRGAIKKIKWRDPQGNPHSFVSEYQEAMPNNDYLKFTVLRDPFAQVTSLYNQIRDEFKIKSLEEFILSEKRNFLSQNHYINQYDFTHIKGELAVDKVFVFDRYHEAQTFVESVFNLKVDKEKKIFATKYTNEVWTKEMIDKFSSVHYQSIYLYHKFLTAR
jgi:hypothetical protein